MKSVQELFEELNEWVYIADMDSYELVYMNRCLRELYHQFSGEDYKEKKCYAVLQGRKEVCSFCTNAKLKPGEFCEWTFKDLVLKKKLLIKETMFIEEGHHYRLGILIDTQAAQGKKATQNLKLHMNFIINECIRLSAQSNQADQAIRDILAFLGQQFECDRSYIFEKDSDTNFSNTYEWCKPGIASQVEVLQNEPQATVDWWWQSFESERMVIIENIEDIKQQYPHTYACLIPQQIKQLVAVPIKRDGRIAGLLGVDNPFSNQMPMIAKILEMVSRFVSTILERRDLMKDLEYMSYHDQLTGALNRHSFAKKKNKLDLENSLGVVYADISGLKKINDNIGHDMGDVIIKHWYHLLQEVFGGQQIFRTGGDEFVVLCPDMKSAEFEQKVDKLKAIRNQEEHHISLGWAWNEQQPIEAEQLLALAEGVMYEDKRQYYTDRNPLSQQSRGQTGGVDRRRVILNRAKSGEFYDFVRNNYFNEEMFFRSITASEASYYLYFGDLQTNLFYVSDNMRETFGFQSNLVFDLIGVWEKRICNQEDLMLYRNDMERIMRQKRGVHDLRYRVKDEEGNEIWIRCYGLLEWSPDRSQALFFSGCISRQEKDFLIDPVTNYRREYAAGKKISELQEKQRKISIIVFGLNHFAEINELKGRYMANILLQSISQKLEQEFSGDLLFYRLDGLRFMAIVLPNCHRNIEAMILKLKQIVSDTYLNNNIAVRVPCSIGLLIDKSGSSSAQDILVSMMSLLTIAKRSPEQKYVIHSDKNIRLQKQQAQMVLRLGENVLNGFENFRIVIQPIVAVESHVVISGESLLRWRFEGKDISPLVFIPLLEKNRLILPLGRWIFEEVVRVCKRIVSYQPAFRLSFNVSYYQVLEEEFIPFMKKTLGKYNLAGKHLILELTETHFDDMPHKLNHFISSCQQLGMEVALDDFGNGYSSLGMLLKYPASIVKLDRSLLNEMTSSQDNMNFISSIVYACHKFGKKVCAEGVETEAEVAIIEGTGCDMIQGFFFYPPLEIKNIFELFSRE